VNSFLQKFAQVLFGKQTHLDFRRIPLSPTRYTFIRVSQPALSSINTSYGCANSAR
jgi:hypothetical protein